MQSGEIEVGRILDIYGGGIFMHNGEGCPLAKGSGIMVCSMQCTMVGPEAACSSVLELFTREPHSNGRLRPTMEAETGYRVHACRCLMHNCDEVTRAHAARLRVA